MALFDEKKYSVSFISATSYLVEVENVPGVDNVVVSRNLDDLDLVVEVEGDSLDVAVGSLLHSEVVLGELGPKERGQAEQQGEHHGVWWSRRRRKLFILSPYHLAQGTLYRSDSTKIFNLKEPNFLFRCIYLFVSSMPVLTFGK